MESELAVRVWLTGSDFLEFLDLMVLKRLDNSSKDKAPVETVLVGSDGVVVGSTSSGVANGFFSMYDFSTTGIWGPCPSTMYAARLFILKQFLIYAGLTLIISPADPS